MLGRALAFTAGAIALLFACSFDDRTLTVHGAGGSAASAGQGSGAKSGSSSAGSANGGSSGAAGLEGGEKCTADDDCASNFCIDGVCCEKACEGECVSCSAAVTGKADGACEKVPAGMDPHDDCAQGKDVCGKDGQCDGAGACRYAVPSTNCGAETCANDQYTPGAQCDGAGKCVTPAAVSCSGHPCVDNRCDIPCTKTTDCPTSFYCDGKTCVPQKTDGSACTGNEQCSHASCSGDKVCCDKACDMPCYSCLQADTGQTDGKCAPVLEGRGHAQDCPGAASCNAGATSVTPAPACDGAGACKTPADVPCGNYKCDAGTASCKTMCSAASDCSSGGYCSANACKTKLAAGALCTSAAQCQSGDCSGRCCASGNACNCPQPSANNLVKNPGFDKDLSSWTIDSGPATINWQPGTFMTGNQTYADGHDCPYSGAAYVSNPSADQNSQLIWQCVAIKAQTDYNFGVQQATLSGAYTHCTIDTYAGPGCTGGNPNNLGDSEWINVAWSSGDYPTMFNSGFYVSAKIACYVEPGGSFFFDNVYLTPSPGKY